MNLLPLIWSAIIVFGVIMYVILGGFDIGIGIMSIFFSKQHDRDLMISSILPVWDGNQTWLVFGGAALYGAFPLAFSILLPILYIPILMMVIALLFRGVAFEFRLKAIKSKRFWEICFFLGSLFATIAQGLILGAFVKGFSVLPQMHNQSLPVSDWFNSFSIFCALALICGYVLLGANYLIIKTQEGLQKKSYLISQIAQFFILAGFIAVSVWSPFLDEHIRAVWFNLHNMVYLAILPFLTMLLWLTHYWSLKNKKEFLPFWCAIGMFVMCYMGFIISSYPFIVPRKITYIDAAAGSSTLLFMLIGACIMLPPLLYYTYYSYRIFRGKIVEAIGY